MKAAIYLRVSTERQTERNQEPECQRLCEARGWAPEVVAEVESGAAKDRPGWRRVLELARLGQVRAVVVWSIDRAGRQMHELVADVRELDRLGCAVVSVREPWLDTTGPTRDLLLAIFAWVAEHERERLRERTRAGLARAVAAGKRLGRPPVYLDPHRVAKLLRAGTSVRRMARRLGVARATVRATLAKMGPLPPRPKTADPGRFRDSL